MRNQVVLTLNELLDVLCVEGVVKNWHCTVDGMQIRINRHKAINFNDVRLYVETKDAVVNVERAEVTKNDICKRHTQADIILVVTK